MHAMTNIVNYESPRVNKRVVLQLETAVLLSSAGDALNLGGVDTKGQDHVEHDFTDANFFTHEWQ